MATHFSILAWRIPWTEKPAGPHSMGLQRVRHNWAANTFTFIVILILTEALRNCLYTWHTLLDSHCRVVAQFPLGSQESITSANTVTPFFVCWFRSKWLVSSLNIQFSGIIVVSTRRSTCPPGTKCMHVQSLRRVHLFATLGTIARQAPLSMGFSRQEYWSGLPCSPPRDLPDPGMEPVSSASLALAGRQIVCHRTTWEAPLEQDH